MIAFLNGRLSHKEASFVVLEVNGVGYHVFISLTTYSAIKSEESCKLFTHLHVKEDAHTLYGFSNSSEKATFLQLIAINGVGPSTALTVLSTLSSQELKHAIVNEEVKVIQSVKGIGAKTAQRIILELKDKLLKEGVSPLEEGSGLLDNRTKEEALTALVTLGFAKNTAEKGIERVIKTSEGELSLEEIIKKVLKSA
ncbi:Holliday junction branch migration protein RuvA [Cyclobacteriaceae bacterium]|nr:Holliday junction branch migration protein RuvA [Cyclobacteriaceae bacterium]